MDLEWVKPELWFDEFRELSNSAVNQKITKQSHTVQPPSPLGHKRTPDAHLH